MPSLNLPTPDPDTAAPANLPDALRELANVIERRPGVARCLSLPVAEAMIVLIGSIFGLWRRRISAEEFLEDFDYFVALLEIVGGSNERLH